MLQPVLHFIVGRIAFYNSNANIKGKRRGDITSTIKVNTGNMSNILDVALLKHHFVSS